MSDNLFDKNFLELIENGSRRDLANYRNCIIEELRTRFKKSDLEAIGNSLSSIVKKTNRNKRLYLIATLMFAMFLIVNIYVTIKCFGEGNYALAWLNIVVAIMNVMNLALYGVKLIFSSWVYTEATNSAVVVTRGKPESLQKFPEIFNVICYEPEEMLLKKKARLDEMLGF